MTKGDKVVFLRTKVWEGMSRSDLNRRRFVEESIKGIFDVLRKVQDIDYEFLDLDDGNVGESVLDIFDKTMYVNGEFKREDIVVLAAGGTRTLTAITLLYGMLDPRVKKIFGYSENLGDFTEIPSVNQDCIPSKNELQKLFTFLDQLENGVNQTVNIGEKKIRRLIDNGLIRKKRGRGSGLEITVLGKLYKRRYEILLNLKN